jgi:hypothetical protein
MKLYKVIFENNKAVSATDVDPANPHNEDNTFMNGNENIRWLLILGFDEQDSINIARILFDEAA